MYYTRGTLSNNLFFFAPQHSLYIQGISASIPCIPFLFPRSGYPSQRRRGEERGGAAGAPHSGQRATVALSVLLVWPEQPSH